MLEAGTRLGAYEIVSLLGAGGMGEVYRARDTKLGREVAVKLLPAALADDADRVGRFQREAQVLALLNHPHIAAIYGLEHDGVSRFLVLELVEGGTLADRLARGPLPIEEALEIARTIAAALHAAHEKGVIHRDLKPSNIAFTAAGEPKVLDFGLAKFAGVEAGASSTATMSPTITSPALMTGVGTLLGTAAYMAPEQAKGKPADKRSDIWAFGCVLYEMLTGRRAFEGDDVADTLANVLKLEPEWGCLPTDLPPAIRVLLRRSLAKDPRHRCGDMSVALLLIEEAPHIGLAAPAPHSQRRPSLSVASVAAAVTLTAVVAGFLLWRFAADRASAPLVQFAVALGEGQAFAGTTRHFIAISPDGTRLVYVSNGRLMLRRIAELTAHVIAGTETAGALNPVFSPDGESIAFFSQTDTAIKLVPVSGGTPTSLAKLEQAPFGMFWSDAGLFVGQGVDGIVQVSPTAGTASRVISVQPDEVAHQPQLLPDGTWVLFTVAKGTDLDRWDKAQIVVQSLTTGERKVVVPTGSDARYIESGYLVYAVEGTLFAVRFDVRSHTLTGSAVPAVVGVRRTGVAVGGNVTGAAHFAISANGSLMYVPGPARPSRLSRQFVVRDRNGVAMPLAIPAGPYTHTRVSGDGRRLVYTRDEGDTTDVEVYELDARSTPRRLTFDGRSQHPAWLGSSQIAFQSERDGSGGIFIQQADGGAPAERLTTAPAGETHIPESFAPDGRTLLFAVLKNAMYSLHILNRSDGAVKPFGAEPSRERPNAVISPDGQWVAHAFHVGPGGAPSRDRGVYVQPYPAGGTKYQVTTTTLDYHPVWSTDGRELFYLPAASRNLVRVPFFAKPIVSFGKPAELPEVRPGSLSIVGREYDVLPDGRLIVLEQDPEVSSVPEIRFMLNWVEQLKRVLS